MSKLNSYGHRSDSAIVWILEGNELEFSQDEFLEIAGSLTHEGLFSILDRIRPAMKSQLYQIYHKDLSSHLEIEDLEYAMEQCILDLKDRLRL